MERRILGSTGIEVGVLGFGGSEIGFRGTDPTTVRAVIDAAFDAGANLIDTAAAYLESESLIGAALAGRRDRAVIVTKCGAVDGFSHSDWSREGILRTVERSLSRLGTDYVDVVLLHSCGLEEMRDREALEGVREARQRGCARFIGYSGDNEPALWAVEHGGIDVLELSVNIVDQSCLHTILPAARSRGVGVIAKRPIANAVWRYDAPPVESYHLEYYRRLEALRYEDLTANPAEVVLRFTLSQPGVHAAIVGTTRPERWRENLAAASLGELPRPVLERITNRWAGVADPGWLGRQ